MQKIFAFPMAPANYTLDIITNVYEPIGIQYAFVHSKSEASDKSCGEVVVLDKSKNLILRLKRIYNILNENDVFIVNSYTDKISLEILFLNILFFKKPMGISSDTQYSIPSGKICSCLKSTFLKWLFSHSFIYGLPGGTKTHVQLFTSFGMNKNKVCVLPMMVNNDKYFRKLIPRPGVPFKFIYIGRLVACKQIDRIIEGFKIFQKKYFNSELHIVGDGDEREKLYRIADGASVFFHGRLYGEALVAALHMANCLILYSSREPWGLVVNEALASGIPCIVSDAVGARFDLLEGEDPAGIVVPTNDINALCQAMEKLVVDTDLWERLSYNAIKRMEYWNYNLYKYKLFDFITKIEKIL